MNYKRFGGCWILLFLFTLSLSAQSFLSTNGKAIVNESGDTILLRGMGLGGWMLQEGYMLQTASFANAQYQIRNKIEELIGMADTDAFYEAWLANHVRKIDIDSLKAWGFNSVRLPMHYNLFTLPIEEEPTAGQNTWLTKGFELTDSLISWCAQNEMYVVLDLHAAPGGQGQDQGISDYDPTKPSLWESPENRSKTAALWKRIAERYVDEPWVAGYDLLNEPNWNLPGNTLLRNLYMDITDSIRSVDNNHILFIEGNWFANDFTGLTPPWDDNMVYSPHKYWSYNDQASIQWVLDIRETYNVPLYLGESGENSNVWFRDAIALLEANQIGWAWWPMKKIESIAGPLSVTKTPDYQTLLNYWNNGGTTPTAAFAKATLMEITENLKLENCFYQKDVIDAMFRQVNSEETVAYRTQDIPGVVYATDFDMGQVGFAYYDQEVANYQVSSGNFTSWNNGWAYRNDGVDIEVSNNTINSNGYNVGWLEEGEWMQYDIAVAESALYDVEVRVAQGGTGGSFHFATDESAISNTFYVPNTGGWQNWQTITVSDVVLTPEDKKLRLEVDGSTFNVSSFEFINIGATTAVPTEFMAAATLNQSQVELDVNKPLAGPLPASPADFQIFVNGSTVPITAVSLNMDNQRRITFTVDDVFITSDEIEISYAGTQILAQDGTALETFIQEDVENTIAIFHPVPGRVEAEDFFFQSGIQLETTTDVGGGQNIGFLDVGDYLDYYIDVAQAGTYRVEYRTAALSETGGVELQRIDTDGNAIPLQTAYFPATGGWQSWTTSSQTAALPAGQHHIRLVIIQPQFNLNWFEFSSLTNTEELDVLTSLQIFPNPGSHLFHVQAELKTQQRVQIEIRNLLGQRILTRAVDQTKTIQESLDLSPYPPGNYFLSLRLEDGSVVSRKIVKWGA